jgi:hypothetical protein
MAGSIDGMEVPDTIIGGYGVQSCGAGHDGIRRDCEYNLFHCLAAEAIKLELQELSLNTGCSKSTTELNQPLWSQESF